MSGRRGDESHTAEGALGLPRVQQDSTGRRFEQVARQQDVHMVRADC